MSARRITTFIASETDSLVDKSLATMSRNERRRAIKERTLAQLRSTHVAHVENAREDHVSYVHANAVQAAKRHRARHRDAAKRHTEQSQYARARFESHDVETSTFAAATTQRALNERETVDHVADARDRARSARMSKYSAHSATSCVAHRTRERNLLAHSDVTLNCECDAHDE